MVYELGDGDIDNWKREVIRVLGPSHEHLYDEIVKKVLKYEDEILSMGALIGVMMIVYHEMNKGD